MNEKDFLDWCKDEVVKYTNEHLDKTDNKQITKDDVFVVWSCKTLQNKKVLLSPAFKGAPYFEITYNGDKDETYVDVYKKEKNYVVN